MHLPWPVLTRSLSQLRLWRTSERSFRVFEFGDAEEILTNSDYILIDKKYLSIIQKLNDQVEAFPVSVIDTYRNWHWDNYFELKIKNEIRPEIIKALNSNDLKIWVYDETIFVSDSLKKELERISFNSLSFREGFSYFAG